MIHTSRLTSDLTRVVTYVKLNFIDIISSAGDNPVCIYNKSRLFLKYTIIT